MNKEQKWFVGAFLALVLFAAGLLFLGAWYVTMELRDVAPGSLYAWFLDEQLRQLPPLDGLVLKGHDLVAMDGESAGFDQSTYQIRSASFNLCPWADYWIALGYVRETAESQIQECTNISMNFSGPDTGWTTRIQIHVDLKAQEVWVTKLYR